MQPVDTTTSTATHPMAAREAPEEPANGMAQEEETREVVLAPLRPPAEDALAIPPSTTAPGSRKRQDAPSSVPTTPANDPSIGRSNKRPRIASSSSRPSANQNSSNPNSLPRWNWYTLAKTVWQHFWEEACHICVPEKQALKLFPPAKPSHQSRTRQRGRQELEEEEKEANPIHEGTSTTRTIYVNSTRYYYLNGAAEYQPLSWSNPTANTIEPTTTTTTEPSREEWLLKWNRPPPPPPPPEETQLQRCPLCDASATTLLLSQHSPTCPIAALKRADKKDPNKQEKQGRKKKKKKPRTLILNNTSNPPTPTATPPEILPNQTSITSQSLAQLLSTLLSEDNEADESIWPEASGAPRPITILAHHLCNQILAAKKRNGYDTSNNGLFPHCHPAFVCPDHRSFFEAPDDSSVEEESKAQLPANPWRNSDFCVVAGCTLWLFEWNLLLQSTTKTTTTSASSENDTTNNDPTCGLPCTSCASGKFHAHAFDRLIPLFGEAKLSWIVSFQYQCDHCQLEMSGTNPHFLAALPPPLRKLYPSYISWVQPQGRFQVTRSLARRIQATRKADAPYGAQRLAHQLQTQCDGWYAMEEMEFQMRQHQNRESDYQRLEDSSNDDSTTFSEEEEEEFLSFPEWFGSLPLPSAAELQALCRCADR